MRVLSSFQDALLLHDFRLQETGPLEKSSNSLKDDLLKINEMKLLLGESLRYKRLHGALKNDWSWNIPGYTWSK